MSVYNILVVDDEKEIRKLISRYLQMEKMQVLEAENGREALKYSKEKRVDLIILDIMMEGMDGFEVITRLREGGYTMPVIFLTARREDNDKVLGLGLGGDDYVTKPFSPSELMARVKAHLRRSVINRKQREEKKIEIGPFVLNLDNYQLLKNGEIIDLTAREFQLIKFLMKNPQQVFTKNQIYTRVWQNDIVDDNAVMVYIRHLRKKLEEDPANPQYIQTVWGIGYRFSKGEK